MGDLPLSALMQILPLILGGTGAIKNPGVGALAGLMGGMGGNMLKGQTLGGLFGGGARPTGNAAQGFNPGQGGGLGFNPMTGGPGGSGMNLSGLGQGATGGLPDYLRLLMMRGGGMGG